MDLAPAHGYGHGNKDYSCGTFESWRRWQEIFDIHDNGVQLGHTCRLFLEIKLVSISQFLK